MECKPGPAIEGSKVPVEVFVIPAPLHVPPGLAAVKVTTGSLLQYGPAGLIVELGLLFTTINAVSVAGHGLLMV
jgi:hypothetical protein